MKNKKINILRLTLIFMLLGSLISYYKLNEYEEKLMKIGDLPKEITGLTWYNADNNYSINFISGKIKVSNNLEDKFKGCSHYDFYKDEKVIRFNCKQMKLLLKSYSNNRLKIVFDEGKTSYMVTFYSSKELAEYIKENKLENVSDKQLDNIVNEYSYESNKEKVSNEYKNTQISKLSSLSELSVDEYINISKKDNSVVLVLNKNMSPDSYDFIPLYLYWSTLYNKYDFYYIDGRNITSNEYSLLKGNQKIGKYLTGNYDSTIIVTSNSASKVYNYDLDFEFDRSGDNVFDCNDNACLDLNIIIYDKETEYESIDDILEK